MAHTEQEIIHNPGAIEVGHRAARMAALTKERWGLSPAESKPNQPTTVFDRHNPGIIHNPGALEVGHRAAKMAELTKEYYQR